MDKSKSKANFFGFPLTQTGAQIVYILGVLLLIGTLLSSLWLFYLVWNSYMLWQTIVDLGYEEYYAWSMFSWLPHIISSVVFIILAIYMMQCGKKGR